MLQLANCHRNGKNTTVVLKNATNFPDSDNRNDNRTVITTMKYDNLQIKTALYYEK